MMIKKNLGRIALVYGGSAILSSSILVWALRLWHADLRVPFNYVGDALFYGMITKGIMDNGGYLHNPFLGMPAGMQMYDFPLFDTFHFFVIQIISWFIHDLDLVFNGFFLLTFPLTTLTTLWVLRHFDVAT